MWSATFGWLPRHRRRAWAPSPTRGGEHAPCANSSRREGTLLAGAPSSAGSRHSCPKLCRGRSGCLGHHLLALEHEQDLRVGLKAFLKAARIMTKSHQDNDRAVAEGIDLPLLRSGNPHIWPVTYIEAGRTTWPGTA
jgi:hypothetical protein